MATKEGRTIPDSEDEPMTSSPIDDDTDKFPANSSNSQQQTFRTQLQDVICSHQVPVEHVPGTISVRTHFPVVEEEDPAKNLKMTNTQPDNTARQQRVAAETVSDDAGLMKKLQEPDNSRANEHRHVLDSSGEMQVQATKQGVDQGTSTLAEGALKPCPSHNDVLAGERKGEPPKEMEVGEQEPERTATSGLPRSDELGNTPTGFRMGDSGEYTSSHDESGIPSEANDTGNITDCDIQASLVGRDHFGQPETAGIAETILIPELLRPGQQLKDLPVSVPSPDRAYPTTQTNSDSIMPLEPRHDPTTTSPSRKEVDVQQPKQIDINLPKTKVERILPDTSMHEVLLRDAEVPLDANTQKETEAPKMLSEPQDSERNDLPQHRAPSPTKATSEPHKSSPVKGSQEATVAELRAQRAALISSLAALPNIQELIAEIEDDDDSSRGPYDGPTDAEVMTAANKVVKTHIKLLHEYNEMKDVGQGLMGLIADSRGVRIVEVQDEFGVDAKD